MLASLRKAANAHHEIASYSFKEDAIAGLAPKPGYGDFDYYDRAWTYFSAYGHVEFSGNFSKLGYIGHTRAVIEPDCRAHWFAGDLVKTRLKNLEPWIRCFGDSLRAVALANEVVYVGNDHGDEWELATDSEISGLFASSPADLVDQLLHLVENSDRFYVSFEPVWPIEPGLEQFAIYWGSPGKVTGLSRHFTVAIDNADGLVRRISINTLLHPTLCPQDVVDCPGSSATLLTSDVELEFFDYRTRRSDSQIEAPSTKPIDWSIGHDLGRTTARISAQFAHVWEVPKYRRSLWEWLALRELWRAMGGPD